MISAGVNGTALQHMGAHLSAPCRFKLNIFKLVRERSKQPSPSSFRARLWTTSSLSSVCMCVRERARDRMVFWYGNEWNLMSVFERGERASFWSRVGCVLSLIPYVFVFILIPALVSLEMHRYAIILFLANVLVFGSICCNFKSFNILTCYTVRIKTF